MRIVVSDASVRVGSITTLHPVSLVITPGGITAIAGPSGSGKTTLLALIAGAVRPATGSVQFESNGAPLPRNSVRIAWISQSANSLPDRSALDNVSIASLARGLPVAEAQAAAMARLAEFGLDHRASSPARTLSGGELQRLAFARAMAAECDIVLADEPSASLDAANTAILADSLSALSTERTIVVATHDPQLVAACNTVVQLDSLVRPDVVVRPDGVGRPQGVASSAGAQ